MGLTISEIVEACGNRKQEALRVSAGLVEERVVRAE